MLHISVYKNIFIKAFITFQFGYCLLVWMFHSRGFYNKINSLREWTWRIACGDKSSPFQKLLGIDNSVFIYHRNISVLATEMFKIIDIIAPKIMKEHFAPKISPYDPYNNNSFYRRKINSVWHDTEPVS